METVTKTLEFRLACPPGSEVDLFIEYQDQEAIVPAEIPDRNLLWQLLGICF